MNDNVLKQKDVPIITEGELRRSAVAIALTEKEDVILEVRSEKIGRQPGDICLPGGRLEGDETPEQTVVRETAEELKIGKEQIEVIGPTGIFIAGTQEIHSYLCRISGYTGTYQEDEVSQILQVPLAFFLETKPEMYEISWKPVMGDDFPFDKIHGGKNYKWTDRKSKCRFYEYNGYVIWGFTARILEAFAQLQGESEGGCQ